MLECQASVTDIDPLGPQDSLAGPDWRPRLLEATAKIPWREARAGQGLTGSPMVSGGAEHNKQHGAVTALPYALCMANMLSYLEVYLSRYSRASPCPLGIRGQWSFRRVGVLGAQGVKDCWIIW